MDLKAIKIRKAGDSTKVCPVCYGKIIKGMYNISISDLHRSKNNTIKTKSKYYSPNCIYIHPECLNDFYKKAKTLLKDNKCKIKQVKLLVGAKHI